MHMAVFTKASPKVEAGLLALMEKKYGLLFLQPATHQLVNSSCKNVQKSGWSPTFAYCWIKCVWKRTVTVKAEALAHPRSWLGRAPNGHVAPPRTSWRPPVCWGWWCHPRQSPAHPPGLGGRSKWPCSRADSVPVCCHLNQKSAVLNPCRSYIVHMYICCFFVFFLLSNNENMMMRMLSN